ncbi:ATP-binding protein [Kitasatospora sp. NPDC004799]|uniref:ATP-binding protein n=1 Tax=Kitasatospora sp. NPDC004799 TaxID=3154460 RepID=UPI0033B433AC
MKSNDCAVVLPLVKSWDLQPNTAAVQSARRSVVHAARSWSVPLSEATLGDVGLCVDELLTNAVEYVQERCHLTVLWTGACLRVEVADRSPQPPVRDTPDDMATHGRGLLLVEALTHAWGWHPAEKGKVVWFEVTPDQIGTGEAQFIAPDFASRPAAQQQGQTSPNDLAGGRAVTVPSPSSRYEIRLIDSRSPHFLLLECWGIYDRERHDYVRAPGDPNRLRRFYTLSAAEARLRHSDT